MKTIVLILCMGLGSLFHVNAQNRVDLTVAYSQTNQRYEVYAIPSFNSGSFWLGSSQITVVLPAAVADAPLSISSVGGGTWSDASQVYAPSSQSVSDFHAIATTGNGSMLLSFEAGKPVLLFSFRLPGGCVAGLRLFNTGNDPDSSAGGMNKGDFRNNVFGTSGVATGELYGANTNNSGTVCSATCTLVAPTLSK